MQPSSDLVRGIRISPALITRYQDAAGRHPDHTGQPDPLPHVAHPDSVPKLPG